MEKTGENKHVNPPSVQQPVKFDRTFTPKVDEYIEQCKKDNINATVKGFATLIGTDVFSINAWAYKKKKDENGNITDQWARPNFLAAIQKLENLEKQQEEEKLNEKQELFCQLYATDREFFGNGVQTYIEVYEPNQSKPNWYRNACSSASEILSNPKVCRRITELLEDGGLNDVNVDKQLSLVILQNADFGSKIAAIREYNKLRRRITEKLDVDVKSGGKPIKQVVAFNYVRPVQEDGTDNADNQANL